MAAYDREIEREHRAGERELQRGRTKREVEEGAEDRPESCSDVYGLVRELRFLPLSFRTFLSRYPIIYPVS